MSQSSAIDRFNRAVEASGAGLGDEAEAGFRAVLEAQPDHAEALFGLGLTLMAAGRHPEALPPLQRASESRLAEPVWLVCLGQVQYLTGDFAGAIDAFDRARGLGDLPANAGRVRARAAAMRAMLNGVLIDDALSLYGGDAEDAVALAREAFATFSSANHPNAARAVEAWLARNTSEA